jgi:pimeloyl-ACP methyl ester carboxylesterase
MIRPDPLARTLDSDMTVRPNRRATLRLAVAIAGGLTLSLLAIKPIEEVGATAIVQAPNAGRSARPVVDGELRVDVGPPAAVISLRVVDAVHPRGTIFVLHGIRDSKESMRGWSDMLSRAGYRAVLVDLRGHGRSTGDTLTYGVRESVDLTQVLDALVGRTLVTGEIGVMGNSYGAATAIQWAGRDPRVKAVVAVAPFSSLRDVVPGYSPLPLPAFLVRRAIDIAGLRGGFDPDDASPMAAIARTTARVLLIHGRADKRIPAWHSEHIAAAGPGHTELVLVDGEGHESVAGAATTRLAERSIGWFDTYLQAAPEQSHRAMEGDR